MKYKKKVNSLDPFNPKKLKSLLDMSEDTMNLFATYVKEGQKVKVGSAFP